MPGPNVPITIRNLRTNLYTTFAEIKGSASTPMSELYEVVQSSTLFNTYAWLGAFPRFREWVGPRYVRSLNERVYQIYNKTYELTLGQDEAYSEDMGVADMQLIMRGIARAAVDLPNDLIIELLQNGQTRVGYDSQFFFDTDHPVNIDSVTGTQSNYEASGFALTRANFIAARLRMYKFQGENGRVFRAPESLALVVPPSLQPTAEDILKLDYIAVAGGTQANTLRNAAKIIVVPELESTPTTWYLFGLGGNSPPPFILQERRAPRFVVKNQPDDDNKFWNGENLFGCDSRYGAGYGAWYRSFKATG